MNVKYLSPYKDDPYGKLRGEKQFAYMQLVFSEAKVHKSEQGYVIAGHFETYQGVTAAFKPEQGIQPGMCAVPLYSTEYEIRTKVGDKWEGIKHQPSIYEKALCDYIYKHEELFLNDSMGIKGSVSLIPDGMCASLDEKALVTLIEQNIAVEPIAFTGKLPAYTPPTTYRKGGSSFGGSRGVSPEEKLKLVKKELAAFSTVDDASENDSLGDLVMQVWSQHVAEEDFMTHYFDLLGAVAR